VLGMRLVATLNAGPMRHYFFEMAPENTVAFFEVKKTKPFQVPAGMPDLRKAQFDHLSFNVADEHALEVLRKRIDHFGCGVTEEVDHGFIRSIYFSDPNGIALEASYWVDDATARDGDPRDSAMFADHDPVPAVLELMERGELASTPKTTLS
jgi:catechol-2,3-dioxygenase